MLFALAARGDIERTISAHKSERSYPLLVLEKDNWNDFGYLTTCSVHVIKQRGDAIQSLGAVRVIRRIQAQGTWTFESHPKTFHKLGLDFCSLSTDSQYYKNLRALGLALGRSILLALRDAAYNQSIWHRFEDNRAFKDSLLRETSIATFARDVVPKLFGRSARKVNRFVFTFRPAGAANDLSVSFDFLRRHGLPGRMILLVGPNGSGKTQLLSRLAIALTGATEEEGDRSKDRIALGKRIAAGQVRPIPSFYAVMAISFNAFDRFEIPKQTEQARFSYTYCGLRTEEGHLRNDSDLTTGIRAAINKMSAKQKRAFRAAAGRVLPDFKGTDPDQIPYEQLSAGQKISLNVITHLIANIRKKTLVLLDEPETHLHPTLIVSLLSEISLILESEQSNAIIATHSPLIAQQVPSRQVRVLTRTGDAVEVTGPHIECFGAAISELSNALFEASEHQRDYTYILDQLLEKHSNKPQRVNDLFPKGLGENARLYLWAAAEHGRKKT